MCQKLEKIGIPSTVKTIDMTAFESCPVLFALEISQGNAHFSFRDGMLFDKEMKMLFLCLAGTSGVVEIPEGVETIAQLAFDHCVEVTNIHLPNSLREVGQGAFYCCWKLSEITIPKNVSLLPDGVFEACWDLTGIHAAAENNSFVSLDGVFFDKGMKRLIAYPASGSMIDYVIPSSVSEIASSAFFGCSKLKNLTIHNGVTMIGEKAFQSSHGSLGIYVNEGSYAYTYLKRHGFQFKQVP